MTSEQTEQAAAGGVRARDRKWWGLAVVALAQLMVMLDTTIINIALPSLQGDLGISDTNRHWVITGYTLAFGGALLLGGRFADRLGRTRTFKVGLAGFALASLGGALAQNTTEILAARVVQGLFAAVLAPSTLSILTTMFTKPAERAKAFGLFSGVMGAGTGLGMLVGGVLTDFLDWRWCLAINIPMAVVALLGSFVALPGMPGHREGGLDLLGALLESAGLVALVYGLNEVADHGWGSQRVLALLGLAAVLLAAFVLVESKSRHPLLPLRVLANRNRVGAFIATGMTQFALLGMSIFISYQFQTVMGYSPLKSGVAFLPLVAATLVSATQISARLMIKVPTGRLVVGGLLSTSAGVLLLTQLRPDSPYATNLLPASILMGFGIGLIMSPTTNISVTDVATQDTGIVSAFRTTSQQIGGSLGIALGSSIAANAMTDYIAGHRGDVPAAQLARDAYVNGANHAALGLGLVLLATAVVAGLLINVRPQRSGEVPVEQPTTVTSDL
ncbi:MFS transporter [Streptomyces sp. CT34]|uniref:MFS transporter n=1 Tax=Streptomyces sp. CT34 TaxID=1553907 RepID=UPI00068E81DD|nr:MFS transporter [Streptomyces sp. CT34]